MKIFTGQKTKMHFIARGDYSTTANCREKKIPAIFRQIFGVFERNLKK
jgi:hypothetical protein